MCPVSPASSWRRSPQQETRSGRTIHLRLEAVRRLAFEAADCELLGAGWATGIRRVKGVKKLGVGLGNRFMTRGLQLPGEFD